MVKEEPEDEGPEEPAEEDLLPVPPGLVLDSLSALLKSGRVLLGFRNAGGEWGVNGKLEGEWCSFKAGKDSACQYLKAGEALATEAADGWADSEIELLEQLRQELAKLPTSQAPQPLALQPRRCRRAVFNYHRAEFAKQRKERAKAKAKAAAATAADDDCVSVAQSKQANAAKA